MSASCLANRVFSSAVKSRCASAAMRSTSAIVRADIYLQYPDRMDNVCHTLVGAAMAEAGLKKYSAYASVTLMIAANLPDVDVLVFATDTPGIEFRRGWTHGVVGQALLPIGLTLAVMLWARLRPRPTAVPFRPLRLLGLAYVALYSH